MPIVINSPHSGRPVKIRDEDIGRAVRDQDGRVFYVVPRPNGEGYYAALTRKGSAKDEERYDKLETRIEQVQEQVDAQSQAVHDATGKRRTRPGLRAIAILIIVAGLVASGLVMLVESGRIDRPGWWPIPPEPVESAPPDGPTGLV